MSAGMSDTEAARDLMAIREALVTRHKKNRYVFVGASLAGAVLHSDWLAAHDERVRESERERLAGASGGDDVLYSRKRGSARNILRRAKNLASEVER